MRKTTIFINHLGIVAILLMTSMNGLGQSLLDGSDDDLAGLPGGCSERNLVVQAETMTHQTQQRCLDETEVEVLSMLSDNTYWLYGSTPATACTLLWWEQDGLVDLYAASCYWPDREPDPDSAPVCGSLELEGDARDDLCGQGELQAGDDSESHDWWQSFNRWFGVDACGGAGDAWFGLVDQSLSYGDQEDSCGEAGDEEDQEYCEETGFGLIVNGSVYCTNALTASQDSSSPLCLISPPERMKDQWEDLCDLLDGGEDCEEDCGVPDVGTCGQGQVGVVVDTFSFCVSEPDPDTPEIGLCGGGDVGILVGDSGFCADPSEILEAVPEVELCSGSEIGVVIDGTGFCVHPSEIIDLLPDTDLCSGGDIGVVVDGDSVCVDPDDVFALIPDVGLCGDGEIGVSVDGDGQCLSDEPCDHVDGECPPTAPEAGLCEDGHGLVVEGIVLCTAAVDELVGLVADIREYLEDCVDLMSPMSGHEDLEVVDCEELREDVDGITAMVQDCVSSITDPDSEDTPSGEPMMIDCDEVGSEAWGTIDKVEACVNDLIGEFITGSSASSGEDLEMACGEAKNITSEVTRCVNAFAGDIFEGEPEEEENEPVLDCQELSDTVDDLVVTLEQCVDDFGNPIEMSAGDEADEEEMLDCGEVGDSLDDVLYQIQQCTLDVLGEDLFGDEFLVPDPDSEDPDEESALDCKDPRDDVDELARTIEECGEQIMEPIEMSSEENESVEQCEEVADELVFWEEFIDTCVAGLSENLTQDMSSSAFGDEWDNTDPCGGAFGFQESTPTCAPIEQREGGDPDENVGDFFGDEGTMGSISELFEDQEPMKRLQEFHDELDPCLTYSVNGMQARVPVGQPHVFEDESFLWFVGAPVASFKAEVGSGCEEGLVCVQPAAAGVAGTFIVSTPNPGEFDASVEAWGAELALEGDGDGADDRLVSLVTGEVWFVPQTLPSVVGPVVPPMEMDSSLQVMADVAFTSNQARDATNVSVRVDDWEIYLEQAGGLHGEAAHVGWALRVLLERSRQSDPVNGGDVRPTQTLSVAWDSLVHRPVDLGLAAGESFGLGLEIDSMPRGVEAEVYWRLGLDESVYGIEWDSNQPINQILGEVNEVPFRLTTPPRSFSAELDVGSEADVFTGHEWSNFEFDLRSHGDADTEDVIRDPEGSLMDDPGAFGDDVGRRVDEAANRRMGVSLVLGETDVVISGASHNLHISGGHVSDMGDHPALIPFVRLTAFDPVNSGLDQALAKRIVVNVGQDFQAEVEGLHSLDVDTTAIANNQDNEAIKGYNLRFTQQGSVRVEFEADDKEWLIEAIAQCKEYSGNFWLESHSFSHNEEEHRGNAIQSIGAGTIDVQSICSDDSFSLTKSVDGDAMVRINDIERVEFDFDATLHEFEIEQCQRGECWWSRFDGVQSEIFADVGFGSGKFALDLREWTDLDLVMEAEGLEALNIDAQVQDGRKYDGGFIEEEIDVPIGWTLEPGGIFDFKYKGIWEDLVSYSVEVGVTAGTPTGKDSVDFGLGGGAWANCWFADFELDRTGDQISRCGEKITLRTPVDYLLED